MPILLDTHLVLWWLADSKKLSSELRAQIGSTTNVFVSSATVWEVSIKSAIGKLPTNVEDFVAGIRGNLFYELPILQRHALATSRLPPLHRDPFDRMLVAQAISEGFRFLTNDRILCQYSKLVDAV